MPPWFTPTVRATPWLSLVSVTFVLIVAAGVAGIDSHQVPPEIMVLACGAIAGAATLALHDVARPLVQAVSTGARIRLTHRLVLLVPVAAAGLALTAVMSSLMYPDQPWGSPPMAAGAALLATGVAGTVWLMRWRPEHAAEVGAAIAAGWAVAGAVVPPRILPESVSQAWVDYPWPIVAVASVLIVVGTGAITS